MKFLLTCLFALLLVSSNAQTKQDSIRIIAETLVNASAKAFANFNYEQQFSLVSEDVVLILTDLSKIENKQGYLDIIKRIGDIQKSRGLTRSIQFRYHKFSINAQLAYAEGLFKIVISNEKEGTVRQQYSAFRHVYRLENGQWKVLVDSHTTNPGLTEEDFLKAKELTDFR